MLAPANLFDNWAKLWKILIKFIEFQRNSGVLKAGPNTQHMWAVGWLTTNENIFTQRKIDPSMIENSSVAILQIIEARDEIRKNWWVQFQTTRSPLSFNQTAKRDIYQLRHATRGRGFSHL